MSRLFWLLIVWPLAECLLLAWIASKTSWAVVVGLVLGTGLAGALLLRRHSWRTVDRVRTDLAAGRVPAAALWDGVLIFVAGGLLILPGVLSDAVALLLLVPASRHLLQRYFRQRFSAGPASRFAASGFRAESPPRHDQIIDVRVIESPRGADGE